MPTANFKKFKDSFRYQYQASNNFRTLAFASAIALLGFLSTLGWNYLNTKWQGQDFQTTIVYENQNRAESQTPQSPGYGTSPGSQIVIRDRLTTETIVKTLGSDTTLLGELIDQRLNRYLAEGRFKGDKGDPGLQGSSGGGYPANVGFIPPGVGPVPGGGTISSATYFNANYLTVDDSLTVNSPAVFEGPTTLNGTTIINSLTVSNINPGLTQGSIIFQGPSGLTQDNANFYWDDTNNRFGIGTSTPLANLTVVANASSTPLIVASSTGLTLLTVVQSGNVGINTSTPQANLTVIQINNGDNIILAQRSTDTSPSGDFIRYNSAAGTALFRVDNSGNITAPGTITGGALTITSTSTPQLKVQYDSSNQWTASTSPSGITQFTFNSSTGTPQAIFTPQTNMVNGFVFQNASLSPVLSIDTANRRVGINTTTPSQTFSVIGIAGAIDIFDVSSSTSTSVFRIAATGNVGIGTTTPNALLNVYGNLLVATSSTPALFVNTGTGNVGIGTTTPGRTLTIVGDIRATGILYDSTNAAGSGGNFLMSTAIGYQWTATSTLFGGSQVRFRNQWLCHPLDWR